MDAPAESSETATDLTRPGTNRQRRVLIAGCGYVGQATARLLHARGWDVLGATPSLASAAALAAEPYRVVACDIADRVAVAALVPVEAVIHCASSGRGGVDEYRKVYLEGARVLSEALAPRQFIFTSSTSVYAQVEGEVVTEDSAATPKRETGRILREAEEFVLAQGGTVARVAGIYGPGRSVLLQKFFRGEAVIEGDGGRFINQVHRDDLASALVLLLKAGTHGIFNVCDDESLTQRAVYEWMAQRFGKPLPPSAAIDPNRKRGWTNKRVSNARLRALGWTPQYPSFREAVEQDPALTARLLEFGE
jgi:nucleoside-diphosphate-sugar epimerase